MIWTEQTLKAMRLAGLYHSSQVDKLQVPYLYHLYAVADKQTSEEGVIVGFLHDLLEDVFDKRTKEEANTLIVDIFGFSEEVFQAIWLLRHDKNTPYQMYIEAIAGNPLAKSVKLADLEHNLNPDRLQFIEEKTKNRLLEKYTAAYNFLTK